MEEESETSPAQEPQTEDPRCPKCDSVVPPESEHCIMCGARLSAESGQDSDLDIQSTSKCQRKAVFLPFRSTLIREEEGKRRPSWGIWLLIGFTVVLTAIVSILVLRSQGSQVILALQPTFTAIPPAPSLTPTWTPQATHTPIATQTPIPSNTPLPTDTPRPPRFHSVAGGESIFGLSLLYRVSAASIAETNNLPLDSQIQVGQELNIPWPTATPPLESMVLEIGGEHIVADVSDCEIITIQEGDSAYGLSAQRGVPAEAIMAVNRLTEESIQLLHPGDTLCIPRMIPGDSLPPTVGPEPTVTVTSFPPGPSLLYPIDGAEIDSPDGILRVQWVSVKDLLPDEWYMVEVIDVDQLDGLPYRAFTRDTSLSLPGDWRADVPELHEMNWRVSIVKETGRRSDGGIIYEYGGRSSEDGYFYWFGAELTPTPTITPTAAPTVESS